MESRMAYNVDVYIGFMNFAPLLRRLAECEMDSLFSLVNQDVICWRQSRNAIHEAMKINVHPISPWPARVIQLRDSLMSGYKLLPAYDVAVRWARRSEVVCYAPSDFSFQVS
jgi:hypothetical protein